jgi:hypothetical protein
VPVALVVLAALGLGGAGWVALELEAASLRREALAQRPLVREAPRALNPPPPAIREPLAPAPEPPPAIPEPVEPPAPTLPAAIDPHAPSPTAMSWRCEGITEVSPVLETAWSSRWFFAFSNDDEPQVVVVTGGSKALEQARQFQKAITACRGTASRLVASRTANHGPWGSKHGELFAAGTLVDTEHLKIVKPGPDGGR